MNEDIHSKSSSPYTSQTGMSADEQGGREEAISASEQLCDDSNYVRALQIVETLLRKSPLDIHAMIIKAEALLGIGRIQEARQTAEFALDAAERSGGQLHGMTALRVKQLLSLLWEIHTDSGNHAAALSIAKRTSGLSFANPEYNIVYSLIALGDYGSAERLLVHHGHAFAIWSIAFHLVYQRKYKEALPYFRRRLAFVSRPTTKDFLYVLAYLECLVLSGDQAELRALCHYWLDQRLSVRRQLCIKTLLAVVDVAENLQAATVLTRSLCSREEAPKIRSEIISELSFEETVKSVRDLFSIAFDSGVSKAASQYTLPDLQNSE